MQCYIAVLPSSAKKKMAETEHKARERGTHSLKSAGGADPAGGIYGRLRVAGEGSTLFSILSRPVILGVL